MTAMTLGLPFLFAAMSVADVFCTSIYRQLSESELVTTEKEDATNKKSKPDLATYPTTQISTDLTEPYNPILTTPTTMEHSDHAFTVDNGIRLNNKLTESPTSANLNRLIAQIVSCIRGVLWIAGNINDII